jgi:UDPglucose 6-dehydrogenase
MLAPTWCNSQILWTVSCNPEFLREGSAIRDFTHPDRILVGVDTPRGGEVMEQLYRPLALRKAPIIFTTRESAELAKHAVNAFLAMKIKFINEDADLCETVGADVEEAATAIGADGRIGPKFLHAGPGYGGSCFPKDVSALIRTAREARSPLTLFEQVEKLNIERGRDGSCLRSTRHAVGGEELLPGGRVVHDRNRDVAGR